MPHPSPTTALAATPGYREVLERLPTAGEALAVCGAPGALPAALLAGLAGEDPARVWMVVAATPEHAEEAVADLEALCGHGSAYLFPQVETLPYEEAESSVEIGAARVEALDALLSGRARILVTTSRALQERTAAVDGVEALRLELAPGDELRPQELSDRLERMGFERVATVEEVGQFAWRGGIFDVYAFGSADPIRIEFWGDTVESLRRFAVLTQLSTSSEERVQLLPVRLGDAPAAAQPAAGPRRSLLEYLPPDAVLVPLPDVDPEAEWPRIWAETERLHRAERERGAHPVPPSELFLPPQDATRRYLAFGRLRLVADDGSADVSLGGTPPEAVDRDLKKLGEILRRGAELGEKTLILCDNDGQLQRLQQLLEELRVSGGVRLRVGSVSGGFVLRGADPPFRLFTDHEIFSRGRRVRRRRRFRGGAAIESVAALQPGDYVVHMDHGVGRFRGLERVQLGAEEFETLVIEYAGGEILRLPVHRVDLIERWVSDDEDAVPPAVHKIGGRTWSRTKQRAQQAIEQVTAELLELYAAREAEEGFAFSSDSRWQREMESAFLFEDTRDQRQATEDVKRDMESPRPMDRLICGDVGYGKTEIAVRAAFKAVQDGRQVAVLAPTTILAEQHLHTFRERLANFPVRIEALSRFRTQPEQREVLRRLAAGEVDVLVGTHRILSADVSFHDLGLMVVDEEQRFGVRHKERLKQLRRSVDVLTLTATPIPRTLQFSLLGLRDMTLIQTPPRDRQPIVTHVVPWTDATIEDAIQRERDRGGQIFFVHNRVETIGLVEKRLHEIVPDARVGVAHGQMREKQLEQVMRRFLDGELDVLLATAIIESGLDVPNANTLIVDRADTFGLAQLYQIRGRVGRSHHRAYCYLLIPEEIPEDAEKRLRVLEHYTELGSGYRIALKDLELRGAGNILGSQQSGHVHAVGLDTYLRLVEETVRRIKGEVTAPAERTAEVSVDGVALIPDDYITDEAQKLNFYRRLSRAETPEEIEELRRELRDRFGALPEETETLLSTASLRMLASTLGVERVLVRPWDVRLNFRDGVVPRMTQLQSALAGRQFEVEVKRPMPLALTLHRRGAEPILPTLLGSLETLVQDPLLAA